MSLREWRMLEELDEATTDAIEDARRARMGGLQAVILFASREQRSAFKYATNSTDQAVIPCRKASPSGLRWPCASS
jgi:hypothetical protein